MKRAQRRFARRQLTWMRRMEDVTRSTAAGATTPRSPAEIVALIEADA